MHVFEGKDMNKLQCGKHKHLELIKFNINKENQLDLNRN